MTKTRRFPVIFHEPVLESFSNVIAVKIKCQNIGKIFKKTVPLAGSS